jgi:hypothetical protein
MKRPGCALDMIGTIGAGKLRSCRDSVTPDAIVGAPIDGDLR